MGKQKTRLTLSDLSRFCPPLVALLMLDIGADFPVGYAGTDQGSTSGSHAR